MQLGSKCGAAGSRLASMYFYLVLRYGSFLDSNGQWIADSSGLSDKLHRGGGILIGDQRASVWSYTSRPYQSIGWHSPGSQRCAVKLQRVL